MLDICACSSARHISRMIVGNGERAVSDVFSQYGYPEILNEIVSRIVEAVHNVVEEPTFGILIVGSASRGELSWIEVNNRIELFSDIEFVIAFKKRNNAVKRDISKRIKEIEKDYSLGDLFHIDFDITTWAHLPSSGKKIFVFDSKMCGLDLGPIAIGPRMPDVNKDNLNWKELNDICMHRLKALLRALPMEFLLGEELTNKAFLMSIVKNTLDITTWLHPYEARQLTSGYRARLKYWKNNYSSLKLSEYLSEDGLSFMERCLVLRNNPYEPVNLNEMFATCLELFMKAMDYCKEMNNVPSEHHLSNLAVSAKLFDEYRIKRRIGEALSIISRGRKMCITKAIRNMFYPRKGNQVSICTNLLLAANEYVNNDSSCWKSLSKARTELEKLICDIPELNDDFIASWYATKLSYKELEQLFI